MLEQSKTINRGIQEVFNRYFRVLSLCLIASALGAIAWGVGDLTGFAIAIFCLWSLAQNRREAFFIVTAYYLGGSWVIPEASKVFFADSWSLEIGIILWVAAAALNALAWAVTWHPFASTPVINRIKVACRQSAILFIALLLPPFTFAGWLNPFHAAAWFFPGFGFFAFALGFILSVVLCVLSNKLFSDRNRSLYAIAGLIIGTMSIQTELPSVPSEWVGIDTALGAYAKNEEDAFVRRKFVAEEAFRQIQKGKRVVAFPETVLGFWNDQTTGAYLSGALRSTLDQSKAVVIVGSAFTTPVAGVLQNSLAVLSSDSAIRIDSRQPIPVSMWKPWASESFTANWASTGVYEISGRKVMVSFCYEDYLPILSMVSFALDKPEIILSVANAWWVKGTNAPAIQYRHIATTARIFGVPLVRASNS